MMPSQAYSEIVTAFNGYQPSSERSLMPSWTTALMSASPTTATDRLQPLHALSVSQNTARTGTDRPPPRIHKNAAFPPGLIQLAHIRSDSLNAKVDAPVEAWLIGGVPFLGRGSPLAETLRRLLTWREVGGDNRGMSEERGARCDDQRGIRIREEPDREQVHE